MADQTAMKMLGEQTITVTSKAAGSYVDGDWVDGASTARTFKGVLQPLDARTALQVPEQWRTAARWKIYSKEQLKTVNIYGPTSADAVSWDDPVTGTQSMLVVGVSDYSNTPFGMTLRHFKYVLIEQQVSDAAR